MLEQDYSWTADVARAVANAAREIGEPITVMWGDCEATVLPFSGSLGRPFVRIKQAGEPVGAGWA